MMPRHRYRGLAGVILALQLCATGHMNAHAAAVAPAAPPADALPEPDAESARYILGPGDVIEVFVWQNPDLSTKAQVLPDGYVSTPLVEGVLATGKTPVQLARSIEVALSEYVRAPRVSVLVSEARSTFSQIKLVGRFNNPQALPYRDGMTVLDAVLQAGGLTQFASGNRAKIVRTVDGKETEIRVRLTDLLEKGDTKQNIRLKPGDILVVPESFF